MGVGPGTGATLFWPHPFSLKKMKLLLTLPLFSLLLAPSLWAEEFRSKNPVQIQWIAPQSSAKGTTQYGFGAELGYHLNPSFYLGVLGVQATAGTNTLGSGMVLGIPITGQPNLESNRFTYDPSQAVELRYSPVDPGVYLSVGYLSLGAQEENYVYKKQSRVVGNGTYATDLTTQIKRDSMQAPGLGVGFTHVFANGFSFTIGGLVAVGKRTKTIVVAAPNPDSPVSDADMALLKNDIQQTEDFTPNLLYHAGLGWNF
ncbi:MAG: hypothetical protein A2600_10625 [Candidatus Lambdaproteobacteria bacterium RIFOXYD1_FULL_56_27]|uniref:Uncharacterized protein n=1 Tax=Candidatus Lambdaproteobacteria bacterium RIFOXYD2_FULL_56_26 TaxID=1817773 RepID=A0A1F6GZ70_9PROT|nr:MAG: hypothetical protein A2426_01070 [Candidatus Lambdaproteobacteria bacterium RIFOXYC1_FULL_56_13]OGH03445.1 MAG: hypothetical protein A2557_01685 [Candidatus Lambdaproteobacteria bacterium RIFOXYD2_FULL_56_26]OGH08230.1 MAG: hypothetical protein A2600_10625 [Candidatus Lambdaproteobacteria bacterium RIFOXYD1_FULL_56_27]